MREQPCHRTRIVRWVLGIFMGASFVAGIAVAHRWYWYTPIAVCLNEIGRLSTREELPGTWWTVISDEDSAQALATEYGIILPENDFVVSYLLVSAGREMRQLTYTRASGRYCYREGTYMGRAVLGASHTPNIYYVYRVPPVRIWNSEQAAMGEQDTIEGP